MTTARLRVTRDPSHPDQVLVLKDGTLAFGMSWSQALEFAKLIAGAARRAEEYSKANQIIGAEALLIRTGAPFGLSLSKAIREASYNAAQWDTTARKGMPLAKIPSRREVYAPTIKKEPRADNG
jgi:hypothetical protein